MISVGELLAAACQRFTDRPALVHGKDMRTYGEPAERGASFCLALARQGARVVVNNRNRVVDAGRGPPTTSARRATRRAARRWSSTPTRPIPAQARPWVEAAVQRWGRLDICVANAAIGVGGMFHRQPAGQFNEVLAINLQGSIRLARAAMAVMRPAATAGSSWSPRLAGCTATSACPPTPPARVACWPRAAAVSRRSSGSRSRRSTT